MNALQTLVKARAVIADRSAWCQGCTREHATNAVCSVGAILMARRKIIGFQFWTPTDIASGWDSEAITVLAETIEKIENAYYVKRTGCDRARIIASYNDSHSHEEVLAVFDKAIASLQPAESTHFMSEAA